MATIPTPERSLPASTAGMAQRAWMVWRLPRRRRAWLWALTLCGPATDWRAGEQGGTPLLLVRPVDSLGVRQASGRARRRVMAMMRHLGGQAAPLPWPASCMDEGLPWGLAPLQVLCEGDADWARQAADLMTLRAAVGELRGVRTVSDVEAHARALWLGLGMARDRRDLAAWLNGYAAWRSRAFVSLHHQPPTFMPDLCT